MQAPERLCQCLHVCVCVFVLVGACVKADDIEKGFQEAEGQHQTHLLPQYWGVEGALRAFEADAYSGDAGALRSCGSLQLEWVEGSIGGLLRGGRALVEECSCR